MAEKGSFLMKHLIINHRNHLIIYMLYKYVDTLAKAFI